MSGYLPVAAPVCTPLVNAVGPGCRNDPLDVALIQDLLQRSRAVETNLEWTGDAGSALFEAIGRFQMRITPTVCPDRIVQASGPIIWTLASLADSCPISPLRRQGSRTEPSKTTLDAGRFVTLYGRHFGSPRPGLKFVVGKMLADSAITDIRWIAYMLATVRHETQMSYEPVAEIGKGAGYKYGNPDTFTDSAGKSHTNIYYGRGYVQLTWKDNYAAVGEAIGQGERLAIDPELARDPDIAYDVLSYGMRKGRFTGRKLGSYISGDRCDYYASRAIVNPKDTKTYQPICQAAAEIEVLARLACMGSSACYGS